VDEVKLQSYFDGELPLEQLESITSHLASCVTCATAARELEEESALVMNALAAVSQNQWILLRSVQFRVSASAGLCEFGSCVGVRSDLCRRENEEHAGV
jgi:hypothetical protein